MTNDEALEDHEYLSRGAARRALMKHGCVAIAFQEHEFSGDVVRVLVSNGCDPAEWLENTPAAILGWLGY